MPQAWLDSLSEDWVSQPASDVSPQGKPSQNLTENPVPSNKTKSQSSRLPHPNQDAKHGQRSPVNNSSHVLSERSLNEINIASFRRGPSKLSQEIKVQKRGRYSSRSLSVSTSTSIVHSTVNHKTVNSSPVRNGETPEWKRRLVYGDLSYGEQRDLFTSAGAVLESIFKPPPVPAMPSREQGYEDQTAQYETTLPSSPPVCTGDGSTVEIHEDDSVANHLPELPKPQDSVHEGRYDLTEHHSNDESVLTEEQVNRDHSHQDMSGIGEPNQQSDSRTFLRKASGLTDVRNEDFSPILLSRRDASDGRPTFTPVEVPASELRKRLENLRRNQMLLIAETDAAFADTTRDARIGENTMDNTEDYEKLGPFINVRRGGRSADGSFRHRLLSPPLNDVSELLPEESLQASTPKQFPTVRMEHWEQNPAGSAEASPPHVPRPPHPSPEKRFERRVSESSPASPLKLFQPYDTFTNQTLLRRISQFEGQGSSDSLSTSREWQDTNSIQGKSGDQPNPGAAMESAPSLPADKSQQGDSRAPSASANHFGAGDLDGYEFNDDISYNSNEGVSNSNVGQSQAAGAGQGKPPIFDLTHDSSSPEPQDLVVNRRRQKSFSSSRQTSQTRTVQHAGSGLGESMVSSQLPAVLMTPRQQDVAFEGKRMRTTPAKDPTPKRRRTLHKTDISYTAETQPAAIEPVQLSHQQMQTIIGKKRKDARHGEMQQLANPSVLASRQILRPRTPTPSQRSSLRRSNTAVSTDESFASSTSSAPKTLPTAKSAPAATALDTDRKPSIKTEDFINEANKIMAMIRSKAGLRSGLASVEESASENVNQEEGAETDDSFRESTREPFSRPPSREGRPPPSHMAARQEDPEVAQRLKKYEEGSEMGDIITSSMRSLGLVQDALRAAREVHQQVEGTLSSVSKGSFLHSEDHVISDPPNIRISRNPDRSDHHSADSLRDAFPSNSSGNSSGNSTNRSIPTGSSRGSDTRRTIAPESVEHLIPDRVGNMVLDRERNIWVKKKPAETPRGKQDFLPSEGSEDDPFVGIPDLTVDMTMELRNLKVTSPRKEQSNAKSEVAAQEHRGPLKASSEDIMSGESVSTSVRPGNEVPSPIRSSLKGHKIEANQEQDEVVEHEISIHEDRVTTPRRRNLTITFSSPIASVIQDVVAGTDVSGVNGDDESAEFSSDEVSYASNRRGRRPSSQKHQRKGASSRSRSSSRPARRQISVRGQTFVARPVSRIDEQDEDTSNNRDRDQAQPTDLELSVIGDCSIVEHPAAQRRTSLSFVVTTPARGTDCPATGVDGAPIISQYVGTLSLSPLSDFTAHQDESSMPLEVSYVIGGHHLTTNTGENGRKLSTNTRELVQKLADVEPFEPYWEDMRELDIRGKQLESLHALDEFCGSLESLDASDNQIRNLTGVPGTVRQLKVTGNRLSSLTAWGHLMNLQYVDVSNNELSSLAPFKNLVHLRSLRADNNEITNLDGIKYHSGLLALRARGNAIEEVDLEDTRLCRLTELDLKGNRIRRVSHIEQLVSLSTLNLEDNQLESLDIDSEEPFSSLKYLSVSNNSLSSLDLKRLPGLRLLHADRNCLVRFSGFSKAHRLDSLSLREQRCGDKPLDLSFLSRAYEVRKLYLSGNFLENFDPQVDLLNLQLLELSNCGLQSLPGDLGQMMPNLRAVNLNFNAISDLSPLRFIPRLKRVLAAGNRLSDPGKVIDTLSGFPYLTSVDLRDNPMTQGFYPALRVLLREGQLLDAGAEAFSLPDGDPQRDALYASRLDLETRMRRRVYEQVFVASCRRLKRLDGLAVRRDIGSVKDAVWTALAARGLVISEDGSHVDAAGDAASDAAGCSEGLVEDGCRWGAEDSFA
ncbi:hypothetical protein VTK73DRAFT_3315 [Phialemonium thermophilum]|uniref:Septation initiation network scaffold protein cdc11 n=1 Tax=Phialemonium thermophilum TaxID=223376 RepID=A0ABR3Y118_9PEZI